MTREARPTRVSLVATPDVMVSPVMGIFELLSSVKSLPLAEELSNPRVDPFQIEVVGERAGPVVGASGLSITVERSVDDVVETDVVIVPSVVPADADWVAGRYPGIVDWMRDMHSGGAMVCSACTGGNLTAETGLLDGHEATVHWISVTHFRSQHPKIVLRPDEALVVSGEGGRLVTSGAATAWHDLGLYLIARYVGPATAQAMARFQLMSWHHDGQAAFGVFHPPTDHNDAVIASAQRWIGDNFSVDRPVERMVSHSGIATRTFKRRFKSATTYTPTSYVQRLRVEQAKRLLENSSDAIEEISWMVGYSDPASFRRLFRRLTGMPPGEYRQRFRLPELPNVATPKPEAAGRR